MCNVRCVTTLICFKAEVEKKDEIRFCRCQTQRIYFIENLIPRESRKKTHTGKPNSSHTAKRKQNFCTLRSSITNLIILEAYTRRTFYFIRLLISFSLLHKHNWHRITPTPIQKYLTYKIMHDNKCYNKLVLLGILIPIRSSIMSWKKISKFFFFKIPARAHHSTPHTGSRPYTFGFSFLIRCLCENVYDTHTLTCKVNVWRALRMFVQHARARQIDATLRTTHGCAVCVVFQNKIIFFYCFTTRTK